MKTAKFFYLLTISLIVIQACNENQKGNTNKLNIAYDAANPAAYITPAAYNNTKGYWENGRIITEFDCPDDKSFPPIDIKSWDKIKAVNGRFPTYEETLNGTSIHHYGEKENSNVKPYNMTLPKLAYRYNKQEKKEDLVVVIQIVQTAKDTIVGFRYLTGGCGGSPFHDYRFLTDEEVQRVMAE